MPKSFDDSTAKKKKSRKCGNVAFLDEWTKNLLYTEKGNIRATQGNIIKILINDNRWNKLLASNTRDFHQPYYVKFPPYENNKNIEYPRLITESDLGFIANWMESNYGVAFSTKIIWSAILSVASYIELNEIVDWFESLQWDGTKRLDKWLIDCAGALDNDYTRKVSSFFLIGAVARAYLPGTKVDTLIILEGHQGKKKSTLFRTITGKKWFSDTLGDLKSKDTWMQLQKPLIIEVADLDAFSKKETTSIKQFLSVQEDQFRPPYGRVVQTFPRRCVFCGTTNKLEYLKDDTGGRRFWPVKTGEINLELAEKNRAQYWAEAVARYKSGEKWYFEIFKDERAAFKEQEKRREIDPWEPIIFDYLKRNYPDNDFYDDRFENGKRIWTSTDEILIGCLSKDKSRLERRDENRVGSILGTVMGWKKVRSRERNRYMVPAEWFDSEKKQEEEKQQQEINFCIDEMQFDEGKLLPSFRDYQPADLSDPKDY